MVRLLFRSLRVKVLFTVVVAALTSAVLSASPVAASSLRPEVATPPGAPTNVMALPGNKATSVRWTPPANDGGSPITGYVALASPGSHSCTTTGATSCTVGGLVNGHTYSVSVTASNKKGSGPSSASVTVKPGVPLAPTHVTAVPGSTDAKVLWRNPANNGSRITKYVVTTVPGFKRCTTRGSRTCTVTGLTNDTTYRFRVTATNAVGTGAGSAFSAPATPPVVRTVYVGRSPEGLALEGADVWVANSASNSVAELRASTGSAVRSPILVGSDPQGISADGSHVWVANTSLGSVAELNASDGSNVRTITVGTDPEGISSDGTHVWVANSGSNSVSELDASSGAVLQTVTVGTDPDAVSSDGTHVWLTNEGDGTVTELNAATGAFVETIAVGADPDAISSDGTHVWAANRGSDSVTELDATTGSIVQTIAVGAAPSAIFSDGTDVWVANSGGNSVTELDASTGSVVQTIPVGVAPSAISSNGFHVWVANSGSNTASEIAV